MTTLVAPFFAISEDKRHMTILYGCTCGWRSEAHNVGEQGDPAHYAVRCHLADEHGEEVECGRCSTCSEPTDYFRAHFPRMEGATVEIADEYLCEAHAPAPMVLDQAEQPDDVSQSDEPFTLQVDGQPAEPFTILRSVELHAPRRYDQ